MNIRISSPITRVFYGYDLNDRLCVSPCLEYVPFPGEIGAPAMPDSAKIVINIINKTYRYAIGKL